MGANVAVRITGLAFVVCCTAAAQTVVEPERVAGVREQFAAAARAVRMRCEFAPVRPSLGYDLRFHSGYRITVPLSQLAGSGHELTILLQVAGEGHEPVYLGKQELLGNIPASNAEGELKGEFLVGEGSYTVDALAHDETGRVCTNKWRMQARRSGGERELSAEIPEGVVMAVDDAAARAMPAGKIPRLTILLHAAPLRPRASKIDDATQGMFADSLKSLLRQMPARSVRLVVFNLDQQAVLFRKDGFEAADLPQVTAAFDQLQLARVDVRTLASRDKVDLLSDLVEKELREGAPASAVILMAPRAASHIDPSVPADPQRFAASHWFYLQYEGRPFAGVMPTGPRGVPAAMDPTDPDTPPMMGGRGGRAIGQGQRQGQGPSIASPPPDQTEQAFRRFKGQTFAIRAPHDLAEAIHRMAAEIPVTKGELASAAPAPAIVPPLKAPSPTQAPAADQPVVQEHPVEVLMKLRDQVLEHARRIPNHMCVEAIQRDRYEPPSGRLVRSCAALLASRDRSVNSLKLKTTDWLRLDVGVGDTGEIFSWAGASQFDERELDEIVPEGAIGTGIFATQLIGIFENRDTQFEFNGERDAGGVRLMAYSFTIPQERSGYRVKTRQKTWVITGYSGELLVDPKTASLAQLTVHTDELPESTGSCEIDTALEYGMTALAGFDYLLPTATRQRFIGREGEEAENRIAFSACREYRGESTLMFGTRPEAAAGGAESETALTVPAGQPVTVELVRPVPFEGSAAGDRIEGRLAVAMVDAQRQATIVPNGAKVEGRLMRVEMGTGSADYTIALRWETVEVNGVKIALSLKPKREMPGLNAEPGTLRRRGRQIELPRTGEELYGIYHVTGKSATLPAGFRTEWMTFKP